MFSAPRAPPIPTVLEAARSKHARRTQCLRRGARSSETVPATRASTDCQSSVSRARLDSTRPRPGPKRVCRVQATRFRQQAAPAWASACATLGSNGGTRAGAERVRPAHTGQWVSPHVSGARLASSRRPLVLRRARHVQEELYRVQVQQPVSRRSGPRNAFRHPWHLKVRLANVIPQHDDSIVLRRYMFASIASCGRF